MVSPMARQFKHLRTGVYWFRQRVPEDVRALVGRKEASGLSRASAARRAIRHRCWRQGLRAGLQAPPQARPRHRPATRRPQGRHVGASPARSRPPPRQAPGNAAHDTGRPQTPPRQQGLPQRPLRLHHAPRRAADQQRLRTGAATLRDLPQGHRRLPLPMGSACLRRSLYRHRHRKAQPHICPPGHLKRPEAVPGLTPMPLGPEQLHQKQDLRRRIHEPPSFARSLGAQNDPGWQRTAGRRTRAWLRKLEASPQSQPARHASPTSTIHPKRLPWTRPARGLPFQCQGF